MEVPSWLHRSPRHLALLERVARVRIDGIGAGARVAIALPPGPDFEAALHAVWLNGAIAVPHDLRLTPAERPTADLTIDGLEVAAAPGPLKTTIDLRAVAVALQTSGTTSAPKPVDLTFGNLLWSALGSAAALDSRPGDRWLCTLPLSHVGGLSILARSAIYGTEAIIHERWETDRVLAEDPTLISLVPVTLTRLLDAGWAPRNLRWALLGGAPIPPELLARAEQAGIPVAPTYGLTEAASQVTTFGAPLFCTRVELEDDGEIVVSGPTVSPSVGGPLRTGDLGARDDHGSLTIVGRKADTIVTGGENVAPAEVEAVLEAHPAVAEAAVVGRADPEWGERVEALVVLASGIDRLPDDLATHCAARLARFKVPKRFDTVPSLPRTASGKLLRRELR